MPIRPQPMRVRCPHCGHDDLERTPLSSWQASLVRLCERWFNSFR